MNYTIKFNLLFLLAFSLNLASQENKNKSNIIGLEEIEINTPSINNLDKLKLIDLGGVKNVNEDFSTFEPLKKILKDVDIVMLGEQSHGEGTAYETKIKLIKYLHQELDFEILAFESDFYACNKAWNNIKKGDDVATSLGESIFYVWSTTKQFKPLVNYIDKNKYSNHPLIISGFDHQISSRLSESDLISDLKMFITQKDKSILDSGNWRNFENTLRHATKYEFKKINKKQVIKDTIFINRLISKTKSNDSIAQFWNQVLKSVKYHISDIKLKTDFRDKQMADNLIWLKEQHPNKKIICWGATSHFLYNAKEVRMKSPSIQVLAGNYYKKHPMMGQYLKEKYKSKVYIIGFTAYQGFYGLTSRTKIKIPKEGTLEYLLGKTKYNNCLLPFDNFNFDNYISRPLGNYYMKNNISNVMDAVIFNRNMELSLLDRNFFLKIYPENKHIKPEINENE
jgi:erythromycin esterase